MICPKCQADLPNVFISESFPCYDCGKVNIIEYHMCPVCATMWRTFNGEFAAHSVTELGSLANAVLHIQDSDKLFDAIKEDFDKQERVKKGEACMSDFVHYCLRCNSLAFPSGPKSFKCSSCEFEWEVIAVE